MNNKSDVSIVLCGTRLSDLKEADLLVTSIRRQYADSIEILFFTSFIEYRNESIDEIILIENPYYGFLDKVYAIKNAQRPKILYLDLDTYLLDRVDELFQLLDKFDIAAAHAPNRWTTFLPNVPDSYPEFNCGVILYRRNEKVNRFLSDWFEKYSSQIKAGIVLVSGDQPSFRELLYHSDLRISVLTQEYNCRFTMGSQVSHKVKILHGRVIDYVTVGNEINSGPRYQWNNHPRLRYVKYAEVLPSAEK